MTGARARSPGRRGGRAFAGSLASLLLAACGPDGGHVDAGGDDASPYAVEVVRFEPGDLAGFGQEAMPHVVLGPPKGQGTENGSRDVVSLGLGGVIELRLGVDIVDGEGVDLLVFENPFEYGAGLAFVEPGEVAVSDDGERWHVFPCAPADERPNGCAGYEPVFANEERGLDATVPAEAGGDAFDLADVGVDRARFVRITDRSEPGGLQAAPSAGFDLDAVAAVHAAGE